MFHLLSQKEDFEKNVKWKSSNKAIFRFKKSHIRIATLAIKSKYFIIPEIHDKMVIWIMIKYVNRVKILLVEK